jgi:hypothetical protein
MGSAGRRGAAALYSRKPNEQHGVADEAKSIVPQVEHAQAYIYDDGISGAEFAWRPGFARLTAALRPAPRRLSPNASAGD